MILVAALLLTAGSPAYGACTREAAGVIPALKACAAAELQRRDAALNGAYRDALAARQAPARLKLRAAERAWIKRRDTTCAARMKAEGGGQEAALAWSDCMLSMTAQRTVELRSTAE